MWHGVVTCTLRVWIALEAERDSRGGREGGGGVVVGRNVRALLSMYDVNRTSKIWRGAPTSKNRCFIFVFEGIKRTILSATSLLPNICTNFYRLRGK